MSEYPNQDPAWLSLQEELNQMAAETPEMTERFRVGWRQAIRETAQDAPETSLEKPLLEQRKGQIPRQIWFRRGLSVAAALVFVLGGTLAGLDLFGRPHPVLLSVDMAVEAALESAEEEPEGIEEMAESVEDAVESVESQSVELFTPTSTMLPQPLEMGTAEDVPLLAARKSEAVEEAAPAPVMAESLALDLEEDLAAGKIQEESVPEAATQPQENGLPSGQEKSPSRMGWGLGLMVLSAVGFLYLFFTRRKR
ncbi:MAG: hypothetical protein IJ188_05990 [Clostridia bacterium]|nr:hypothetical protein [Clostridia bacterium]MBQ9252166.1 hypothetical protein [Clostridia bacterium]